MPSDDLQSLNCLISISFKLEQAKIAPTEVNKKKFPYVVKPKSSSAAQLDRHFMNTTQQNQNLPKVKLYTPENDIPRPRNNFILARSMLSFQEYFNYLSELEDYWHESYYPLYHYNPKRKALDLDQQHTSVIIVGNPTNLGSSSAIPTERPPSATQLFAHHPPAEDCERTFYYEDCTSKFHVNRVRKAKRGRSGRKKVAVESVMKLFLKPSQYPDLLDNKVEDFYLE